MQGQDQVTQQSREATLKEKAKAVEQCLEIIVCLLEGEYVEANRYFTEGNAFYGFYKQEDESASSLKMEEILNEAFTRIPDVTNLRFAIDFYNMIVGHIFDHGVVVDETLNSSEKDFYLFINNTMTAFEKIFCEMVEKYKLAENESNENSEITIKTILLFLKSMHKFLNHGQGWYGSNEEKRNKINGRRALLAKTFNTIKPLCKIADSIQLEREMEAQQNSEAPPQSGFSKPNREVGVRERNEEKANANAKNAAKGRLGEVKAKNFVEQSVSEAVRREHSTDIHAVLRRNHTAALEKHLNDLLSQAREKSINIDDMKKNNFSEEPLTFNYKDFSDEEKLKGKKEAFRIAFYKEKEAVSKKEEKQNTVEIEQRTEQSPGFTSLWLESYCEKLYGLIDSLHDQVINRLENDLRQYDEHKHIDEDSRKRFKEKNLENAIIPYGDELRRTHYWKVEYYESLRAVILGLQLTKMSEEQQHKRSQEIEVLEILIEAMYSEYPDKERVAISASLFTEAKRIAADKISRGIKSDFVCFLGNYEHRNLLAEYVNHPEYRERVSRKSDLVRFLESYEHYNLLAEYVNDPQHREQVSRARTALSKKIQNLDERICETLEHEVFRTNTALSRRLEEEVEQNVTQTRGKFQPENGELLVEFNVYWKESYLKRLNTFLTTQEREKPAAPKAQEEQKGGGLAALKQEEHKPQKKHSAQGRRGPIRQNGAQPNVGRSKRLVARATLMLKKIGLKRVADSTPEYRAQRKLWLEKFPVFPPNQREKPLTKLSVWKLNQTLLGDVENVLEEIKTLRDAYKKRAGDDPTLFGARKKMQAFDKLIDTLNSFKNDVERDPQFTYANCVGKDGGIVKKKPFEMLKNDFSSLEPIFLTARLNVIKPDPIERAIFQGCRRLGLFFNGSKPRSAAVVDKMAAFIARVKDNARGQHERPTTRFNLEPEQFKTEVQKQLDQEFKECQRIIKKHQSIASGSGVVQRSERLHPLPITSSISVASAAGGGSSSSLPESGGHSTEDQKHAPKDEVSAASAVGGVVANAQVQGSGNAQQWPRSASTGSIESLNKPLGTGNARKRSQSEDYRQAPSGVFQYKSSAVQQNSEASNPETQDSCLERLGERSFSQ